MAKFMLTRPGPGPQLPSTGNNAGIAFGRHTMPAGLAAFYAWQQHQASPATTVPTGIAAKHVRPKTEAR